MKQVFNKSRMYNNNVFSAESSREGTREQFPLPLGEGAVLHEFTSARNAGEGKMFAQQTETNLPSYRPNVLTTSNKLDCFANARNDENVVRNDETTLVPQYLSALVPSKKRRAGGTEDKRSGYLHEISLPSCLLDLWASKKVAFTLAEVLITLGIIGVVAAVTMPALISNHQQRVLNTKAKKVYSSIQNAFLAVQNEYGTIGDNSVLFDTSTNAEIVLRELLKHFNGAKFCRPRTCAETDYIIKYATNYYNSDGLAKATFDGYNTILLPDSAILMLSEHIANCDITRTDMRYDKDGNATPFVNHVQYCGIIHFDVNGIKPPNTYGKDVFAVIVHKSKLAPNTYGPYGGNTLSDILTGKE